MRRLTSALLAGMLVIGLAAAPVAARSGPTIVETAIAVNADSGEFSTLIAAVVATDLVGTLNGKRQFTVFAPTDAAFAKLGLNAGNIATALDTATLRSILLYHVAPGNRDSGSVLDASRIRTLNGGFIFPSVKSGAAYVNGSQIVAADIRASNGVIHVIDTVLLP
jgi:uncharacterized surface protein with fasciclin (FAS1) repeats